MGRTFNLRGGTPERLQAVARLVDEQLRQLEKAYPANPLAELAILVALNLADECLESKEEYQELHAEIEQRSKQLIQKLEVHDTGAPPGP
jgi:cell division protein ZapA (FtsZ GTPase activity inhibitor)